MHCIVNQTSRRHSSTRSTRRRSFEGRKVSLDKMQDLPPKVPHAPMSQPILVFVSHRIVASSKLFLLQSRRCYAIACVRVHSRAVCMAAGSSSFHRCATSLANGSSGLGAPSNAWIDSKMVRICNAGDQLPSKRISGSWRTVGVRTLKDI